MATPQPHTTSVKLDPDTYLALQTLQAQRKDVSQTELINLAIRFYYRHADNPELDAMTSHLQTISKRLDDLLMRSAPTLDTEALAQAMVAHLNALMPVEVLPVPVTPEPTPTPPTPPATLRWAERFGRRFRTPPPEHW